MNRPVAAIEEEGITLRAANRRNHEHQDDGKCANDQHEVLSVVDEESLDRVPSVCPFPIVTALRAVDDQNAQVHRNSQPLTAAPTSNNFFCGHPIRPSKVLPLMIASRDPINFQVAVNDTAGLKLHRRRNRLLQSL